MSTPIPNLKRTLRNIKRAQDIISVLVSFGFTDIVQELSIDRLLLKGKRLVGMDRPGEHITREPHAVRLRQAAEKLGPSFVKLAQILATRPDLIPEDWAVEFAKLQSGVPAVPADEIKPHIEAMFNGSLDEHFRSVDFKSFAAASVGQAHHAVLHDGTEVILKVLRPGIRKMIKSDIEIMGALAELAEGRFSDMGYSPVEVVEQFERQVLREMDLSLELRSMKRMASSFEDHPRLRFPKAYPEHSNASVLCMERINGTLLSEMDRSSFTDAERRDIVAIGSEVVFKQCFDIGFFHADPHPGNIFVLRESALEPASRDPIEPEVALPADETGVAVVPDTGSAGSGAADTGIRICLIDFGMTGSIDPHTQELLADLVHGTVNGELDRVIDVVVALTDMKPMEAASRRFRADVWEFISKFQTGNISDLEMGNLLQEFFTKLKRHRLKCPADIVYLIKAITTIEGVAERVCPEFDLVSHVRPQIEGLVKRRYGFSATKRRVQNTTLAYAELIENVPREAKAITKMLQQEQLAVQLKHQGLEQVTEELERASKNISYALNIAALLLCGSILFLANSAADAKFGILFYGGVIAIVLAVGVAGYRAITTTLR